MVQWIEGLTFHSCQNASLPSLEISSGTPDLLLQTLMLALGYQHSSSIDFVMLPSFV
jgi:hypothetical protein